MERRVGSARAVKTRSATASVSSGGIDVVDEFTQLVRPPGAVRLVRLAVALLGQLGETGFDDLQAGARADRFEGELDVGAAEVVLGHAVDAPRERERGRL